ncbi:ABC transporter permease [Tessaracoccus caeni]|uniref:ABC transporter permease n=1 Tax=Tessaracoccus caeni TaxID=3031239 RepID=UPI0023DCCAD3|nr:ABC transporter permease [Tessaracoccus caeni]MDF1488379.1 ABC transporter permease [Tessaracoccus caeni]
MDLLRAELTKAATHPAIVITTLAALIVPPSLALVTGLNYRPTDSRWDGFPIESHGFEVAGFGQPLVILLAALIVGTEFMDDQIRTTLTAVPRRGWVIAAKLTVIATFSALIGLLSTTAAVLLKHAALGEYGLPISGFTTGMAWNLGGVVLNYTFISLIAAGLTVLTRSFIVTLIVLVPMVLGLTIGLVQALPVLRYLPDLAGIQLLTSYPGVGLLDPLPGALVMGTWTAVVVLIASASFTRRDANG